VKVLVTGASGFTGSHLVRHLADAGHQVRILIRSSSRLDLLEGLSPEPVHGDLSDGDSIRRAVAGTERIFHLAALYREARLPDKVYYDVNVDGTRRLAEAALAEGGVPLIYCSTCGVHGEVSDPPVDETAPYNPGDIYQETKVEAEKILVSMNEKRGLPVVILRPVGIYGPGDRRFLKLFRGVARRHFPMIGKGDVFYHLTHVDDVVRGFMRAAEVSAADGDAFILAGARFTTIGELIEIIAREAGVPPPRLRLPAGPMYAAAVVCEGICGPLGIEPPLYRRRLDFFLKHRAFQINKARRVLGWEPKVDLEEGIRQTLSHYRSRGWL
jgi:nucleoside-diphosphate-sugar epimerase